MKHRPALPNEIKELMSLVRAGKLFTVQKWIAEGKPTIPPKPYWFSPLRVAVETGFHSMIELLLQQEIEADEKDYMLQRAVWNGDFEVIKLLIEYGADLHSVDFEDVCRTGHPFIIRYFLDNGIDAETNVPFARALCHPKQRYVGIYMRYRNKIPSFERQLNLALRYHARNGNLKWVSLLIWAGGNPRLRLPEIGEDPDPKSDTSAIEEAVRCNRREIVEKIGVSGQDNTCRMFEDACLLGHKEMMEKLLTAGVDPKGKDGCQKPMEKAMWHLRSTMELRWGFRSEANADDALKLVVRLASVGGRWAPDAGDIRRFRRELYGFEPSFIERMLRTFHEQHVCSVEALLSLLANPKMKSVLAFRYDPLVKFVKRPLPSLH